MYESVPRSVSGVSPTLVFAQSAAVATEGARASISIASSAAEIARRAVSARSVLMPWIPEDGPADTRALQELG